MGTAAPFLAVRPPAAAPLRRIGHLRHCSKCPPPRQTSSASGFDSKTPCFGVLQNPSMSCSLSRRDALICSCLLRFLPQFLPFCHFSTPFSLVLFVQIGAFSYVQIAYSSADSTQKRDRRSGLFFYKISGSGPSRKPASVRYQQEENPQLSSSAFACSNPASSVPAAWLSPVMHTRAFLRRISFNKKGAG